MGNFARSYWTAVFFCFISLPFGIFGQEWSQNFNTADFRVFRPADFFKDFQSPHYPEMKALNPETSEQIRRTFNFLQNNGISIGIGTNSNNHTNFELYLPHISRPDGLKGPTIGVTAESGVGNFYFIDHDGAHHVFGIPGVRFSDLDDPVASRKKLVEIFLLKEQGASIRSLRNYIRDYWNWRDKEAFGRERKEFVELNRGLFSMGGISDAEYVEMFGHFVHGRTLDYAKFFWKHLSVERMQKARAAGVPLGGPNLYPFIGARAESWLFKFILPIAEPIFARYREVGYSGFMAYSESMADFMLQPWYVEWSDRFQFGIPVDELIARAESHLEKLRKGELLGDAEAQSNLGFDRKFLLHEIALFGRRVAELREMGRRGHSKSDFSFQEDEILGNFFEASAELHLTLTKTPLEGMSESDLASFRSQFNLLMTKAEEVFPIEKYLPLEYRQPYIDYSRYWRDITALMVPRYGHNSGALSTTDLKNFIMARRESTRSLYQHQKWKFRTWLQGTQIGKPEVWALQNEMADDYEREQRNQTPLVLRSEFDPAENIYSIRLKDLANALDRQVNDVIIPQLSELRSLSNEHRKELYDALNKTKNVASLALSSLRVAYEYTLANPDASRSSAKLFMNREQRVNVFVDRFYSILYDLAVQIQTGNKSEKISSVPSRLEKLNLEFRDIESSFSTSLTEDLQSILPNKKFRLSFLLSALPGLMSTGSKNLVETLNSSIRPHRFLRKNSASMAKFSGWSPASAPTGPSHFILALNHDQGLIEVALAQSVFDSLGVEKVFLLTTRKAWGRFPKGKVPGDNVIYIEDGKPLDEVVTRIVKSQKSRVGILVCPEGILPSISAATPLAAKPGAFVLARKLAIAFAGKTPVYFLNGIFNGLEHFTSEKVIPLNLKLEEPVLVPSHSLSKNDEWVADSRLRFENLVNEHRVLRQADLIHPRRASATSFPVATEVRPYLPVSKWFNGKVFANCAANLRMLSAKQTP